MLCRTTTGGPSAEVKSVSCRVDRARAGWTGTSGSRPSVAAARCPPGQDRFVAAQGFANEVIVFRRGTPCRFVCKWRKHFCVAQEGEPLGWRSPPHAPSVVQVTAVACEHPQCRGHHLPRFSLTEIRREVPGQELFAGIADVHVLRLGRSDAPRRGQGGPLACKRPNRTSL